MESRASKRIALCLFLIALSAANGPLYGLLFGVDFSIWTIALDGAIGGTILWTSLLLLWPSNHCAPLRRLAFPWHVLLLLVLVALTIPITGTISTSIQNGEFRLILGTERGWSLYLYILLIAVLTLFVIQVAQVIGPRILGNMLVGRYHSPVEERRIFLFLDLIGSTALAKKLGDIDTQRLLTRFFFDLGQPVAEHGGEIHAYIGDGAIITWPFKKGADKGRCIDCFFAVQDGLQANAETYEKLFGATLGIRAGLHGGSVAISECGDIKKSIVYFGNTMNTSARLEGEAKRLEKDLIISGELLNAIHLSSAVAAEPMGEVTLRGHDFATEIFALTRTETS